MSVIDAVVDSEDPEELAEAIMILHESLSELMGKGDPASSSRPVAVLFHSLEADSAMNNDGPAELDDGAAAVEALRELGASQQAELLRRSLEAPDDSLLDAWSLLASDFEVLVVRWVKRNEAACRALGF